ncbi:putative porin [Povalibacter sp.]|uniref:putative porin n=1 Tax=Povalibacter sp. TaxID=1962978 RepID=UPI002F414264
MRTAIDLAKWMVAAVLAAVPVVASAASDPDAVAKALEQMNRRLDQLEERNQQLTMRVDELTRQNETLRAANPAPQPPVAVPPAAAAAAPRDEWESRIKLGGDFRFRHENTRNELLADDRTRESIRARLNAAIKVNDKIRGEIGIATGGRDPRSANASLGEAEARKDIGLDLGYMTWQPLDTLSLTAGKMREPYVRPGRSQFFDIEIRPEGLALNYKDGRGLFGTAFNFWLEERAVQADSMLRGGQVGWDGTLGVAKLKAGIGYWDFHKVRGRFPGFGNGILNELGNSIVGTGANARYLYDYDIGQVFAETTVPVASIPLTLFADYGHNYQAGNGLDTAYSVGFVIGKASKIGQWEAGVLKQKVEKDALFAQWTDSEFAGGVTDNDGYAWRVSWMAMQSLLVTANYYDTQFNVDVGNEAHFDRWQLEFSFTF